MSNATIFVDGTQYLVEHAEKKNLLEACLGLGLDLPYFCWHPVMHSVGACRQCAVKLFKDETDKTGRIVMSCMTQVAEGMRLSINDQDARNFRSQVIELLMLNHPHDCPICDEGGECHLQDMTVMSGHSRRRTRFSKLSYHSQNLGPFIAQEMNRCIKCYRCVRFYKDYAGGTDFDVQGWHDQVFFGRVEDGPLESPFSGNLCEVCPTGVFTDKVQAPRHVRKWDLLTAPSVCARCGAGCSITPGVRSGLLRRIKPRYNYDVNGYFICDRGRYGHEFVNLDIRLRKPYLRTSRSAQAEPAEAASAIAHAREILAGAAPIGIVGARSSIETMWALRAFVGADSFFAAMSSSELAVCTRIAQLIELAGNDNASLHDAEHAEAVVVLGEDVWNTAPMLGLKLKQAARNLPRRNAAESKKIPLWDDAAIREVVQRNTGPLYIACLESGGLDHCARASINLGCSDIARFGHAIAALVQNKTVASLDSDTLALASKIAKDLLEVETPLVVSGGHLQSIDIINASWSLFLALRKVGKKAKICLVLPEGNSLALANLASGSLDSAASALDQTPRSLLIAEANLSRSLGVVEEQKILEKARGIIAIDCIHSTTIQTADCALPSTSIVESSGTMISFEGRMQRFFRVMPPVAPAQEVWRWLYAIRNNWLTSTGRPSIQEALGVELNPGFTRSKPIDNPPTLDQLDEAIALSTSFLGKIAEAAHHADAKVDGRKLPRASFRESGRSAVSANIDHREPEPIADTDSPLAFSMEGKNNKFPELQSSYWAPGWNSDQSLNKFQDEIGAQLRAGSIGVRIFEGTCPVDGGQAPIPSQKDSTLPPGYLTILPRIHTLGSEELSALSPAIVARLPLLSIHMCKEDAKSLGIAAGDKVSLNNGSETYIVQIVPIARGFATLPKGLPGMPSLQFPFNAQLSTVRGNQ